MFKLFILGFLFFLLSCNNADNPSNFINHINNDTLASDTVVYKTEITNEIAGSAYRKRATAYGLVIKGDTSLFRCVFSESNSSSKITLFIDKNHQGTSYQQRFIELKHILPLAAIDYNMDFLSSISFGRLIEWSDLAIEITNEFLEKDFDKTKDLHKNVSAFLPLSSIGSMLNNLLNPYQLKVKSVSLEKVFFSTKESFYSINSTKIDSTKVPNKIIDCITWVNVEKY